MNIKKYLLPVLFIACLFKMNFANAQKGKADGSYILSAITLENSNADNSLQTMPVFEDANMNCLLNSEWEFDDGDGFYKIGKTSDCAKGLRQISWKFFSLKGSNYFQFIRTSAVHGVPANENNIYICEVSSITKESFVLRYPILYADKTNAILLTFTRKQ